MTRKQRVTASERAAKRARKRTRTRRKAVSLAGLAEGPKKLGVPLETMRITDFYKPLKKPVTLRLDADVIAWFKKDGRRYQTRINVALRKLMEREMKQVG